MLTSQKGIALFMALIIILFSAILTFTLSGIALISLKLNSNLMKYKKAAYAAEAGSQYAEAVIKKFADELPEEIGGVKLANGSSFHIKIGKYEEETDKYIIISRGEYRECTSILKIDKKVK